MRVAIVAVAIFLGACAQVSESTNTTLEERCLYRRAVIATMEGIENPTIREQKILRAYQAYVNMACATVPVE